MITIILGSLCTVLFSAIGYGYYRARCGRCTSTRKLDGKTVIITGANAGIGKGTAIEMAKRGATVIMACRDLKKGEIALNEVKEISSNSNVYLKKLDLNSLESVRNFCKVFLQEFSELHILINNAGIITLSFLTTEDGFEKQFGVNHLGHFVLTNLLLERMVKCAPARIINVSSSGHYMFGGNMDLDDLDWKKRKFNKEMAYGQSKLANVLFTKELHRRLADRGVTSYAIHPGAVNTEMLQAYPIVNAVLRNISGIIFKTLEEGAQTSLHCAIQEGLEEHSGDYFENCDVVTPSLMARDAALARALWDKSEEMTKVKYPF